MGRQPDNDKKQQIRDNFLARNRYALDLRFVLRDGKKHPAAILIPGGAYRAVCSFIEGVPIARKLNEKGISAIILYYRVRRKASYPAPMDDLARAVRECLEKADELGLDMDSYSVWGASAGGHLAGSFGTENMGYMKYGLPKPSALILEYPVISMMPGLTHGVTHDNLLGKNATREMEEFTSIEKHVTKNYPPLQTVSFAVNSHVKTAVQMYLEPDQLPRLILMLRLNLQTRRILLRIPIFRRGSRPLLSIF